MNMKRRVRLTESDLHRIVKESVNRVLLENEWQQGSNYFSTDGYENNGQGAERVNFGDNRRAYSLRNTNNGYSNHHRITANKGQGVNGMSYQRFGNGGNNAGQLDSIVGELAQYLGCSPEDVKQALGNLK